MSNEDCEVIVWETSAPKFIVAVVAYGETATVATHDNRAEAEAHAEVIRKALSWRPEGESK